MCYSAPRVPTYLLTLCRRKSYGRLKVYFRTRIFSMLALLIIQAVLMLLVAGNVEELTYEYQSTDTWILM